MRNARDVLRLVSFIGDFPGCPYIGDIYLSLFKWAEGMYGFDQANSVCSCVLDFAVDMGLVSRSGKAYRLTPAGEMVYAGICFGRDTTQ